MSRFLHSLRRYFACERYQSFECFTVIKRESRNKLSESK